MSLFCLTHSHPAGREAYIFEADHQPDAGEAAAQLGVDWVLRGNVERIAVYPIANVPNDSPLEIRSLIPPKAHQVAIPTVTR